MMPAIIAGPAVFRNNPAARIIKSARADSCAVFLKSIADEPNAMFAIQTGEDSQSEDKALRIGWIGFGDAVRSLGGQLSRPPCPDYHGVPSQTQPPDVLELSQFLVSRIIAEVSLNHSARNSPAARVF